MILFIVMGVILVVGIMAIAILRIISSHSRLTHHQVTRIQAQYAARAGVMYALDKLRRNDDAACWPTSGSYTIIMRSSTPGACVVIEPNLPASVSQVDITVYDYGTTPGAVFADARKVSATATFTYTPD